MAFPQNTDFFMISYGCKITDTVNGKYRIKKKKNDGTKQEY